MSGRRKKKHGGGSGSITVELNVMPFIDIFSLLTTFLLFSAVFVKIGVIEVQIPFLSSAPPDNDKPVRSLSVKTDLSQENIEINTEWSESPKDPQTYKYKHNEAGITKMHKKLIDIRLAAPETDTLTLFVDDEITYKEMAEVLDSIKLLDPGDPSVQQTLKKGADTADAGVQNQFLFLKVVMGSVAL